MSALLAAYDLIIIEDEATPLAPSAMHVNYYLITLTFITVITIAALLASWFTRREALKKRLIELNGKLGRDEKIPFKIKTIKEYIEVAETDLSASMI